MESLFEFLDRKRRERGPMPTVRGVLAGGREAVAQMDAAMHGASDVIPFGAADRIASLVYATAQPSDWMQRYKTSMAAEAARDREDTVRYPTARAVGELGLTAATLARGGG